MKITFEFDRLETISSMEQKMRNFIKFSYSWLSTDGEVLGHILAVTHFIISGVLYLLIIACHIVYPSTYFQIGVFVCVLIVWLQHILLKVCISVIAEKEFTNVSAPSLLLFKEALGLLGISFTDFMDYFVVAETVCVGMFGLELLSKLSVFLYGNYGYTY